MTKTLLLNASFEPLSVISWKRAITLLFMGKVEIVEEYEDKDIRSVASSMKMPSVVRLLSYVRRRYFGLRFSRQNIYARDSYLCQYCGRHMPEEDLSFDHVMPRSRGGKTCWENIVTSCVECNRQKGGRTPEEAGMHLISKPTRPNSRSQIEVHLHRHTPPQSWLEYLQ